MAPLTRSQLLSTAQGFLTGYNKWTASGVLSLRSPTCVHRTGPNSHGLTCRTNEEFASFVAPMLSVFRNFKLAVIDEDETLVDVEKRKVMMHLRSHAETDVGPYENEYYFTVTVSEDGGLVNEVVEFLDSKYTDE